MAEIRGTDASDNIVGGNENDTIIGSAGNDTLNGGGGWNVVAYWNSPTPVGVQLGRGLTSMDGFNASDVLLNIHGVFGSAHNDVILGSDWSDLLAGLNGSDTLEGQGGDDAINGYAGNDRLSGGAGNDTAYFGGNRGDYTVSAITGGFTITHNSTFLDYGTNVNEGADTVTEVEFFQFADGLLSAAELLNPSANRPTAGDDSLNGGAGNDRMDALAGNDTIKSGAGNDTLIGGAGNDSLDGGAGFDTAAMGGAGFRGAGVSLSGSGPVITSAAGTDTLANVEVATFADGRLVFDAEHAVAKVVRLYQAALGRDADQGGLNAWTGALEGGGRLTDLANGFLSSAEFAQRFGGLADNGAFIDRMYLNVLGREADAAGKQNWLNAMNGGMGRADVLVGFSESGENKLNTADTLQNGIWDRSETAAQVARLYDTVLGRRADVGGLENWKNAVENGGMSMATVADSFTKSAEFQQVYGNLNNTQFVQTLYRNTLEREADQGGLNNWVTYLNSGAARSDAVLAFSESQEHINLTAGAIQSDNPAEFGILFA